MKEVQGNTHKLGIASSTPSGGWFQSGKGSLDMGTSGGNGATVTGYIDDNIYNRVNYRDYFDPCSGYKRMAVSTNALLSSTVWSGQPFWGSCNVYSSGEFEKNSGTNVTYGTGVDVGPISVTAQAGWTTETKETWVITRGPRCADRRTHQH
jgi:hypothetical protein